MTASPELSEQSEHAASFSSKNPLISNELFSKLAAQDPNAWIDFFEGTSPFLTRYAHNPQDAEDAVLHGLTSFAQSTDRITHNPSAYLITCVANAALSTQRKNRRDPTIPASVFEEEVVAKGGERRDFLDQFADQQAPIADHFVAYEELQEVQDAIQTLPLHQQEALLLTGTGYTDTDIAQTAAIPEATVRTRLFRARRTLDKALHNPTEAKKQKKTKKTGRKTTPTHPETVAHAKKIIEEVVVFTAA